VVATVPIYALRIAQHTRHFQGEERGAVRSSLSTIRGAYVTNLQSSPHLRTIAKNNACGRRPEAISRPRPTTELCVCFRPFGSFTSTFAYLSEKTEIWMRYGIRFDRRTNHEISRNNNSNE
jgi:hypothetical protein